MQDIFSKKTYADHILLTILFKKNLQTKKCVQHIYVLSLYSNKESELKKIVLWCMIKTRIKGMYFSLWFMLAGD